MSVNRNSILGLIVFATFIWALGTLAESCVGSQPYAIEIDGEKLPKLVDFNYHIKPIFSDRCFAMLEDTLVIWGGEFGRTSYTQGQLTPTNYGRDHHPKCFTIFMAGAGIKAGFTHGKTDEYGYNIIENPMHIHDLQATLLHLMGVDHERLTYKHQGRRYRLTDQFRIVNHNIIA